MTCLFTLKKPKKMLTVGLNLDFDLPNLHLIKKYGNNFD